MQKKGQELRRAFLRMQIKKNHCELGKYLEIRSIQNVKVYTMMGPVPKILELRSVPFFFSKVELVPFPFPISKTGTSSVPVPFPFI